MADIEPPSFSLGLDLDFDPTNIHQPSISETRKNSEETEKGKEKEDEDEFNLWVSDSETDSPKKSTLTRFRRLRRGGPSSSKAICTPILNSVEDDIEEFSDDNANKNDYLEPHHHASCSGSKLPLSGCGVLKRQPESTIHRIKVKQESSCSPTCLGSGKRKTVFPDFAASPLRRFQLLDSESDPDNPSNGVQNYRKTRDKSPKSNKQRESEIQARFRLLDSESDSDDPSNGIRINRKASSVQNDEQKEAEIQVRFNLINSESDPDDTSDVVRIDREASNVDSSITHKQKEANNGSHKVDLGKNKDFLPAISQKKDLWQDFCVSENCSVQTPAFDELCAEYFKTAKLSKPTTNPHMLSEQEISVNNCTKTLQPQDSASIVPPSYRYFFHDDLRIQRLVCSRLPYFCPLSTSGDVGFKSPNASTIDYMSQFGQDGAKRQTGSQVTVEKSSRRGRKRTKNSNMEDTSLGSGDWIDPKQTPNTPKDAGRRRVHADGQSAGRWFIAKNGMKVYVSKNGKELTGQLAYRHYRKESGRGFKKSRKKGAAKKK